MLYGTLQWEDEPVSAKRGQCATCLYRFRLRKDGTVQVHHLFCGSERNPEPCKGSGKPPRPLGWDDAGRPDCGECLMYLYGPHAGFLAEGIYSVSIETGGDPQQMLRDYLSAYHERDHKEAA